MNDVSLREYIESVILERDKRLDERWHAQQAALMRAEEQVNARLELLNELRVDVLTRSEYEAKHSALTAQVSTSSDNAVHRVEELERVFAEFRGRAVTIGFFMLIFGGVIGALIAHVVK